MDSGSSVKAERGTVRGDPDATIPYRFKPGQSGNPDGRPKYALLSKAYKHQLEAVCETDPQRRTYAEVIAETLAKQAAKGNIAAAAELCDRVEGRPRQAISVGREEDYVDTYNIIERLVGRGTRALAAGEAEGSSEASGEDAPSQ
jgi:hypothetical protein